MSLSNLPKDTQCVICEKKFNQAHMETLEVKVTGGTMRNLIKPQAFACLNCFYALKEQQRVRKR
jgi:hypothetical protein